MSEFVKLVAGFCNIKNCQNLIDFVIKLDRKENVLSIFPHFFLQTYFYESIANINI